MRNLFLSIAAALAVVTVSAQTTAITRARADQIVVDTNGMSTVVYKNLQLDLRQIDTNLFLLRQLALSPTALSNLVVTATANAAYDLMFSFPALIDPAQVPALIPTGATLRVANLYVPGGAITSETLHVTGAVVVGNLPQTSGTLDSTVAFVLCSSNMATACATPTWLFRIVATNSFVTPDVVVAGGHLLVASAGIYSTSFSASLNLSATTTSLWAAWIETTLSTGLVLSNACTPVLGGSSTGFVGNCTYPLAPGSTIRALASFSTPNASTTVIGGGVLSVSKTAIKDAAGATVTSLPLGGW